MSSNNISNSHSESSKQAFFDRPEVIAWILRIFYVGCAILVIIDFLIHRHTYTDIEKIPAFYAIYGCVACVVLVLIANQMRKVLMRGEEYYEPLDPEADIQYPEGFPGHLDHHADDHQVKSHRPANQGSENKSSENKNSTSKASS